MTLNWKDINKDLGLNTSPKTVSASAVTPYVPAKNTKQVIPQKAVTKEKLTPANFRNATNETKISKEQQEKNTQTLIDEMKKSRIARTIPGVIAGSPLLVGGLVPHEYDPRVQEVLDKNAHDYKVGFNPRTALHYQQTGTKPQLDAKITDAEIGEIGGNFISVPGGASLGMAAVKGISKLIPKAAEKIPVLVKGKVVYVDAPVQAVTKNVSAPTPKVVPKTSTNVTPYGTIPVKGADGMNNKIVTLYHGGNEPSKFDIGKTSDESQLGKGFYATDGKGIAEEWAKERGGKIYKTKLDTTNYFDEYNMNMQDPKYAKVKQLLVENGLDSKFVEANFGGQGTLDYMAKALGKGEKNTMFPGGQKISDILQKAGFDGAVAEFRDAKQYVSYNTKNIADKAQNKTVQPSLPQSGAEVPKEQMFSENGDLPKAETTAKAEGLFVDYYPEKRAQDVVTSDDYHSAAIEEGISPEEYITVYRGAPESQTTINNGDWVTTSKQLAQDYSGGGKILTEKVQAKYLYAPKGEGIDELIYSTNAELNGLQKDLGADILRLTDNNAEKYGTFKDSEVPKATGYGDVQKHADTLYNSQITDENMKERLLEAVNDGDFTKYTVKNKTAMDNAVYEMKQGMESARDKFDSVIKAEKTPESKDLALGYQLLKSYQEAGRYEDALTVAEDLSQLLSETGRTLQAARMANLLTPDGRLRMIAKATTKMKKESGIDIKVSEDTLAAVKNAKTEKEVADANKKAFIEIWNQIPQTWGEKLNAWRYMSMLFNPKTHIRNIVGNMIFVPVRTLKNVIGTGLEKSLIKNGERTKAILTAKDKPLLEFAKNDFPNIEGILKNETKFSDTLRDHNAKLFKSKILEGIRTLNGGALDLEDMFFLKRAYNSSFAQYMKANGLKTADMNGVKLDRARKYAMNEAAKATYRDTSELASKLNRAKRSLIKSDNGFKKALGIGLEGTIPFTKTPINILKRGVEYSPVGLLNGTIKLRTALAKGENTIEAIDNLAAGLSGTGILALGAWLNHIGILQGAAESPYGTKKNTYETMKGEQEYSLNFGDNSYTVDWAAPVSMPLFVGAELYKSATKRGLSFSDITDGILSISEPMLNLSMLQGINEAVKTGYNDNAMFSVAETALSGYASQFVPTLGGQITRSIDTTRRATASTAESATQRQIEKFMNKQKAKIPGASTTLEPIVDLWGREQKNDNAVLTFLSPGYLKAKNETPVDKKLSELAANLDEETANAIMPRVTNSYTLKQDGEEYRMTEKELTRFKKTRGQKSYDMLNELFTSSRYNAMTDEAKVKAIKKIYDTAFDEAKAQAINK